MIAVGTTKDIKIAQDERSVEVSVGRTRGLIAIPLQQIEDDHLVVRLKREMETKSYEITVRRGGPVLMKASLGSDFEKMTSSETFTDAEIKENGGLRFRLGDRIRDDAMKVYVEVGLNWDAEPVVEGKTPHRRFFLTVEEIKGEVQDSNTPGLKMLADPDKDVW